MKVCVCDVCQTTEKLATGGLFNLKDGQINIDICGTCAVNVVALAMTNLPNEVVTFIQKLAKTPIARPQRDVPKLRAVVGSSAGVIDDELEKFIAESTKVMAKSQTSEKERIEALTAHIGEQVFIEQFGGPQRIGATVKLGMPGRKTARKVEVVEPVEGKPDHYYVFQIKE